MLTLSIFFTFLMFAVFGKLLWIAIQMSWGLLRILFGLVLFPLLLIGAVLGGFLYLALPVLAITGLVAFLLPGGKR